MGTRIGMASGKTWDVKGDPDDVVKRLQVSSREVVENPMASQGATLHSWLGIVRFESEDGRTPVWLAPAQVESVTLAPEPPRDDNGMATRRQF